MKIIPLCIMACAVAFRLSPAFFIDTGDTIYHVSPATVDHSGIRAVVGASFHGTVYCYHQSGKKVWQANTSGAFIFDLAVCDIDNDGLDETLAASADGTLYCIGHDGALLWKLFTDKPPLYQVCVVKDTNMVHILAGGTEKVLYRVSSHGNVDQSLHLDGAIRNIEAINAPPGSTGKVIVKTVTGSWWGHFFTVYQTHDLARVTGPSRIPDNTYMNLLPYDLNGDGEDEILLDMNTHGITGIFSFTTTGVPSVQFEKTATSRADYQYRMNIMIRAPFGKDGEDSIVGLSGPEINIWSKNGALQKSAVGNFSYSGICYDRLSKNIILGSETSGGSCIYIINTLNHAWLEEYKTIAAAGNMKRVNENLLLLKRQVLAFKPPVYQKTNQAQVPVIVRHRWNQYDKNTKAVAGQEERVFLKTYYNAIDGTNRRIQFITDPWVSENYDRNALPDGWKQKRDRRMQYTLSSQQIVAIAAGFEKEKMPWSVQVAHHNDPYWVRLATIENMIQASPEQLRYIKNSEYDDLREDWVEPTQRHILPIIALCERYNKKFVFDNKHIFWNGVYLTDMYRGILQYPKTVVPCVEDTGERAPDLNISGRTGLWLGGYFSNWMGRAVKDNTCYDRQWAWGAPLSGSHHLRYLAYQACLGADSFFIQTGEYITSKDTWTMTGVNSFQTFIDMINKGIIHIPQKNELVSVSKLAIGLTRPSGRYLTSGMNGHDVASYTPHAAKLVFDRLDCFYGQAKTAEHDPSFYLSGRKRQALNFLPSFPYGLVAHVPADENLPVSAYFEKLIITDGEFWYEGGGRYSPDEYKEKARAFAEHYRQKLPLFVDGDAAWSASHIDGHHIRLVLIDSGYLDPADREVTVRFHSAIMTNILSITDILSGEQLKPADQSLQVNIPAGILRIFDITLQNTHRVF